MLVGRAGQRQAKGLMADWSYAGKWALVTGASAGIGAAFALALAGRGMHLVLTARREERLWEMADVLRDRYGVRTEIIAADLSEPGAPERVWAEAAREHTIHLLVNNAGFGLQGRFDALPRERQRRMVELNCGALLELAHLALGPMRERGSGGIVNVASVAAFQPVPRMAAYAASKAFVLGLSEAIHEENRAAGVRVVALCPGTVPTEFQRVAGISRSVSSPGVKTPAQVVQAALGALERDRGYVVPGALNRLGAVLSRLAPLGLVTRVAGAALRRME